MSMIGRGNLHKIMPLRGGSKRRGGSSTSWRRRFLDRMPSFQSMSSLPVNNDDTASEANLSPFDSDWRDVIEEKHESRDDLALLQFKLL